jgi:transcriptional regulator with XRE-family HTH domain
MVIGKRIRQARHSAGMTQAALARAAGVSERNIVRWENDKHSPRTEHVVAIAQATGKDESFFLSGGDDDSPSSPPPLSPDEMSMLGDLLNRLSTANARTAVQA